MSLNKIFYPFVKDYDKSLNKDDAYYDNLIIVSGRVK